MPHSRTIWKYPLQLVVGPQRLNLPAGALVRAVGPDMKSGGIAIWAECLIPDDIMPLPTSPKIGKDIPKQSSAIQLLPREFHVKATGDSPIAADLSYHGTIFHGAYVWHIFERAI